MELAWRRITTGKNLQHKRFFRHLYAAYEPGLKANLGLLHERLSGDWCPTAPIRIHIPKPSGLLRPLTLLSLEDQIVLQAIANSIARHLFERRKSVELKQVFSNCLSRDVNSIFFLQDWRSSYHGFKQLLESYLDSGHQWIAHFDLAAFYETISHRALRSIVSPLGGNNALWQEICEWLCVWSAGQGAVKVDHGIPQGPLASDFLAEIFLLPIDESMRRAGIKYIRYVDDIRVLAKSEKEARQAAIALELECRKWSLIPQSSKFSICHATTLEKALGSLPSIAESTGRDANEPEISRAEAERTMRAALTGRPFRAKDKARLRYVLYRAGPSPKILRWALDLLPNHPEHIDAFVAYFSNYSRSKLILRRVKALLTEGIFYDYVQGELWQVAARLSTRSDLLNLLPIARRESKQANRSIPLEKGLLAFLLTCRTQELYSEATLIKRLLDSQSYIQSVLVPLLTNADYNADGPIAKLLQGPDSAPGLVIAAELIERRLTHRAVGVRANKLTPQIRNVFRGLGLLPKRPAEKFDQIGDILKNRYGIAYWDKWRVVFGTQYSHALQLLLSAEAKYDPDRSGWLSWQNSFNDAMFHACQRIIVTAGLPGSCSVKDKHGELIAFGSLLDANKPFSRAFPNVATPFRLANDRRNSVPSSHPYERKTGVQTKYLKVKERAQHTRRLAMAYRAIMDFLDPHI